MRVVTWEMLNKIQQLCWPDNEPLRILYETFEDGKTIQHPLTEVFVSGWEVNNFHKLKKDYLFTLNVCATQELHRRIKSQEDILAAVAARQQKLEDALDRIKELETKIEKLMNYISV